MHLPLHEYILASVGSVALACLSVRLVVSRLASVYKFFFFYVLVDLIQTSEPFWLRFGSNWYGHIFLITEGIMLCLYVLIVFELYSVLFKELKGIARLAQRFTAFALVASVAIALALRTVLPQPRSVIEVFFYFESAVILSLAAFILLITAFVVYYPVPLYRNVVIYSMGYAVYFLSKAALLFLNNAGNSAWIRLWSTLALVVSIATVGFWTVFLNRAGEQRTIVVGRRWADSTAQQQILKRLNELNESLARARGK